MKISIFCNIANGKYVIIKIDIEKRNYERGRELIVIQYKGYCTIIKLIESYYFRGTYFYKVYKNLFQYSSFAYSMECCNKFL